MVAGTGTESPLTFSVSEALTLPPLHELPGVARVGQQQALTRTDIRYDTPDRALQRHGAAVYRITDDAGTRWEATVPWDEPAVRTVAVPEGAAGPGDPAGTAATAEPAVPEDCVPPELLESLQAVLRGRNLEPVESATTRMLGYELLDSSGAVAARVTDETRQAGTPGAGTNGTGSPGTGTNGAGSGASTRSWAVAGADGALLEQVVGMFRQAGGRPLPEEEESAAEQEALDSRSPVGSLLQRYLREQFAEVLRHEPRVRRGDADGVHKMRVATRRMRSALASYRTTLEAEPARLLRGELRWLAGILGDARDAQVMRHRLKDLVAAEPEELVMGPVAARIDEELLDDYRKAYGRIREALDSERYFSTLDGLETLIAEPAWTAAAQDAAGQASARMIRRDRKRLHRRVRQAQRLTGAEYAEAMHDARKDAKRLRYAAEVWGTVQPAKAGIMVDAAERVQKILGEYQDSVVTRQYLRRMGASASAAGENGFTYGRMHALEQANAEAAREKFLSAWKDFPPAP